MYSALKRHSAVVNVLILHGSLTIEQVIKPSWGTDQQDVQPYTEKTTAIS